MFLSAAGHRRYNELCQPKRKRALLDLAETMRAIRHKGLIRARQALIAQQAQDRRLPLPQVFSEGQLLSPHVCHGEAKWHLAGVPLERPQ